MLRIPLSPTNHEGSTGVSGWEESPWLTCYCAPDPSNAS